MCSAVPSRPESSSRSWWSLSAKTTQPSSSVTKPLKEIRRSLTEKPRVRNGPTKPSSGLNFNTFAYAFGFKSKKHPSLAIQDPPLSVKPSLATLQQRPSSKNHDPPNIPRHPNRPPSKSVSSTVQSADDSIGPRTPSDGQPDVLSHRPSLMSISDDPFAARAITLSPSQLDPTRLSAYSGSSNKKSDTFNPHDRFSRGSISPSELDVRDALPSLTNGRQSYSQSDGRYSLPSSEESRYSTVELGQFVQGSDRPSIPKSVSSTTLTDKHKLGDSPTRSEIRQRALTDVTQGSRHALPPEHALRPKSSRLSKSVHQRSIHSEHSSTRGIVRQPSASRLGLPSAAPPQCELPPPPIDPPPEEEDPYLIRHDLRTASSHPNRDPTAVRHWNAQPGPSKENRVSSTHMDRDWDRDTFQRRGHAATSSIASRADGITRSLKKATSHSSLLKKGQFPYSGSSPVGPHDDDMRQPRKQRSFIQQHTVASPHNSSPLRHANSFNPETNSSFSSQTDASVLTDSVRIISNGARKRLFSGSSHRRPSTASTVSPPDDDLHSVFSIPFDTYSSHVTPTTPSLNSCFWDEEHQPPGTPSAAEYLPQRIMSPAKMLEVEARVQAGVGDFDSSGRSRGLSLTSVSTTVSDSCFSSITSPPLSMHSTSEVMAANHFRGTTPHSILTSSKALSPPPRASSRPSTAHADEAPLTPISPATPLTASSLSSFQDGTLPPPPRPRPQAAHALVTQGNRSSIVFIPLSPPPMRRASRTAPKTDRAMPLRSIMKKPSFLEIEDDADKDRKQISDSFLELDRESFDTIRSMEEPVSLF